MIANLASSPSITSSIISAILSSGKDGVPNVRFAVATSLSQIAQNVDSALAAEKVVPYLSDLQADQDKDVQFFAAQAVKAFS